MQKIYNTFLLSALMIAVMIPAVMIPAVMIPAVMIPALTSAKLPSDNAYRIRFKHNHKSFSWTNAYLMSYAALAAYDSVNKAKKRLKKIRQRAITPPKRPSQARVRHRSQPWGRDVFGLRVEDGQR